MKHIVVCLLLLLGSWSCQAKLNVHIVAHSHQDGGWLKTLDEYYWGDRQDIQVAGVQYVLDSVILTLQENPDRIFVIAEQSFFMMWWQYQPDSIRDTVKQLVKNGQIEFVNGGYVQNDEACAHYSAMIDQHTVGAKFLKDTFNVTPSIGWQLDPFGHTSTMAGLIASGYGYDGIFFARSDYQEIYRRRNDTSLEMVWRGSNSLDDADVFTVNFPTGSYGPLAGFWWEFGPSPDPPMIDDPSIPQYNVQERVETFVTRCLELASVTRGDDIILTMGSDFAYANADMWFKNLDKLIKYVNEDGRVNTFYSTPSKYVAAKHAYKQKWPLRKDDFFPYADFPHAYWTGYFTSRPASKGYIRRASSILQAVRQLEAFNGRDTRTSSTKSLEMAAALTQHHDSITGTEKQPVANDYHRRLHQGITEAYQLAGRVLSDMITTAPSSSGTASYMVNKIMNRNLKFSTPISSLTAWLTSSMLFANKKQVETNNDNSLQLEACELRNITACETTVRLSKDNKAILVAAYNSLAHKRPAVIRVPIDVSTSCSWSVIGPDGEEIDSELVAVANTTAKLQQLSVEVDIVTQDEVAAQELVFVATLPALGYKTFHLTSTDDGEGGDNTEKKDCAMGLLNKKQVVVLGKKNEESSLSLSKTSETNKAVLSNGLVELEYDTTTGNLKSVKSDGVEIKLSLEMGAYNSSDDAEQPSGAYVFRPNNYWGQAPVSLQLLQGDTVSQATQVFSDWTSLITRIYKDSYAIEFEWTVGPIPFKDGFGREVVIKYQSSIASDKTFWTDANGREMMKRVRDYREYWELENNEPIASNFYPVTAAIAIRDDEAELAVLTERSQAGGSLKNGEIEVMLHRRVLIDDRRGVTDPLNETMCGCEACNCPGLVARGIHHVVLSSPKKAAEARRSAMLLLDNPPLVMFAPSSGQNNDATTTIMQPTFSAIDTDISSISSTIGTNKNRHSIPKNVHLQTFMEQEDGTLLVRLAHMYEVHEDDADLGKEVEVDLHTVLKPFVVNKVTEMSLSAVRLKSELSRLHFDIEGDDDVDSKKKDASNVVGCDGDCYDKPLVVELRPMEIRTFEVDVDAPSRSSSAVL